MMTGSVPPLTTVAPAKVFALERISMPAPPLTKLPQPWLRLWMVCVPLVAMTAALSAIRSIAPPLKATVPALNSKPATCWFPVTLTV